MALSKERQALLKQKGDTYIATMEASGSGVNYKRISTDRLLIVEALNDWSGRLLAEGGDIQLTHGCDDPTCATRFELSELMTRMHAAPVILYPVSSFGLSDQDELRFGFEASSFRMLPHAGGSRSDAISIAESSHIRDVDAAMKLWALCATEDCLSYLGYQMDEHGLAFGDEEGLAAARQIITSALLTNFSAGQVWNAIWRSVKDAAALSTRQYYNITKASQTIPKKIDKVLTQNASTRGGFPSYDRMAAFPMGAVLSLLLSRFGIEDDSPGPEVRAIFAADAALAQPLPPDDVEADESRSLVRGTMFFIKDMTLLDRMVLSCFRNLKTDTPEPEWDENHVVGKLDFSLGDLYSFDGPAFLRLFLAASGVPEPTPQDLARHAAVAKELKDKTEWVDLSGQSGAVTEALLKAGINPLRAGMVSYVVRRAASPDDVMGMVWGLPGESGLRAIRADSVDLYPDFFERSEGLYTGGFTFNFPEERLAPDGCDTDLVLAIAGENIDRLADLVTTSVLRSVNCVSNEMREHLLHRVGERLIALTNQANQNEDGADLRPPGEPN